MKSIDRIKNLGASLILTDQNELNNSVRCQNDLSNYLSSPLALNSLSGRK